MTARGHSLHGVGRPEALGDVVTSMLRTIPFMDYGACGEPDVDPEVFYPDKGGSVDAAKAVCETCPVREQCLEYALRNRERFGVWGGASVTDRRKMLKERKETR